MNRSRPSIKYVHKLCCVHKIIWPLMDAFNAALVAHDDSTTPLASIPRGIVHPPTDPAAIVRHYTLSPEDLALIRQRRRAANRLGFAVHLAYLRFPHPFDKTGSGAGDELDQTWPAPRGVGCAEGDRSGAAANALQPGLASLARRIFGHVADGTNQQCFERSCPCTPNRL